MRPIATVWSVCRSVTTVSFAKRAEPIVMPFGMLTRVGPRNHVLNWGTELQMSIPEGAILRANRAGPDMPRQVQQLIYSQQLSRRAATIGVY